MVKTARLKKEKVVGIVDHWFGHVSVAAFKVKSPIQIGDMIHIKGHTTDFIQRIDSMQIEHQNIQKAKKGDEIGIKVNQKVRVGDIVTLAPKEKIAITQSAKPISIQQPISNKPAPSKPTKFLSF